MTMLAHRYAQVNGVRLHYVTAGTGPLILFLHGFPEFWYAWKAQLPEFGRDHQAVAPDLRGYNLSDRPTGVSQYEIAVLVEDVRALALELSPGKPFVLVGHDWGGVVAWSFAMRHPDLLEKLVILNAPHPAIFSRLLASDPAQQRASAYMMLLRSPQAEKALSDDNFAFLQNLVLADGLKLGFFSERDRAEYLKAWSQPGSLTSSLNYYRAMSLGSAAAPATAAPAAEFMVDVPTLVIWGERDTALLPQNLAGLEHFVPTLTIKRIADATHWVVHEKAAEVSREIREFLRDATRNAGNGSAPGAQVSVF